MPALLACHLESSFEPLPCMLTCPLPLAPLFSIPDVPFILHSPCHVYAIDRYAGGTHMRVLRALGRRSAGGARRCRDGATQGYKRKHECDQRSDCAGGPCRPAERKRAPLPARRRRPAGLAARRQLHANDPTRGIATRGLGVAPSRFPFAKSRARVPRQPGKAPKWLVKC